MRTPFSPGSGRPTKRDDSGAGLSPHRLEGASRRSVLHSTRQDNASQGHSTRAGGETIRGGERLSRSSSLSQVYLFRAADTMAQDAKAAAGAEALVVVLHRGKHSCVAQLPLSIPRAESFASEACAGIWMRSAEGSTCWVLPRWHLPTQHFAGRLKSGFLSFEPSPGQLPGSRYGRTCKSASRLWKSWSACWWIAHHAGRGDGKDCPSAQRNSPVRDELGRKGHVFSPVPAALARGVPRERLMDCL